MISEKDWISLKHIMATNFNAVMGYNIPIRDSNTAPAYTSEEPAIYINKVSIFTKKAKPGEEKIYPLGLFYREMSKLYFSDYDYLADQVRKFKNDEEAAFLPIFHTIENSIVNEKADTFVGGSVLKMIKVTGTKEYTLSPKVEEAPNQYFELITAMLQYSRTGFLKGKFKDKDAKAIFVSIMPDIDKAMAEVEPTNRIDIYLEILKKTKPAWETCLADLSGYMNDERTSLSGKAGSGATSRLGALASASGIPLAFGKGSGSGTAIDEDDEDSDRRNGLSRKYTFEKMSREELEEEDEKAKEAYEKAGSSMGKGNDSDIWDRKYSDEDIDFSRVDEYESEAFEEEVKDCVDALTNLMKSELEMSRKEDTSITPPTPIPDLPKVKAKYKSNNFKVKNDIIKVSDPLSAINNYYAVAGRYKSQIRDMTKRLKTLFNEDTEETEYRESGKISMKRLMSSTVTSKLCEKKVEPSGRSSIAVTMLIDESGSMCGTRIDRARASAIALAEVFKQLNLPLYVMGFTADDGTDVHHRHYLQWSSKTIADRASLTSIAAYCNNFDGYSIRSASEILSKRPEDHKVLIVISDGAPAASAYQGLDGEADTANAIREAVDSGQNVVGVAIGSNKEMLYKMYKDDFVSIENVNDLFAGIMKKFTDMVKKW